MLMSIVSVEMEMIDGVPRIVLHFHNEPRALVLTRDMAEDLTEAFGPHPLVEHYFTLN
jgi:hypothetical protein